MPPQHLDLRLDPLFSSEDRLVAASLSKSWLKKWRLLWKPSGTELAGLISLAVILFGYRPARDAASDAVDVVVAASNKLGTIVRDASHEALSVLATASRRGRSRSTSPESVEPRHQHQRSQQLRGPSSDTSSFQHESSALPMTLMVRIAEMCKRRMDSILLSFLAYKLTVLVAYSIPLSYGFGVKRLFLNWASRAATFRLWLRIAPLFSLCTVVAGSIAVRHSRRPPPKGTIERWLTLSVMNSLLTYCTSRLFELIRGDPRPLMQLEETAHDRDLLAAEPPSLSVLAAASWPLRKLTPPVFLGLENLPPAPHRGLLFVGNHLIWGLDVMLLMHGLLQHRGIWLRPLGEHSWFSVPVIGELIDLIGAIDGTRHNCDLLMKQRHNLLVYPGGARESWKRTTDPKYALLWSDHHLGFVTMAMKHGYTIVPVASVGLEDFIEPCIDMPIEKILTLGGLLRRPKAGTSKAFDKGAILPLIQARWFKAQRNYFSIREPVCLADHMGKESDETLLRKIRDDVMGRLKDGIEELKAYREKDPNRFTFGSSDSEQDDRSRL
eukprot:TRINITY_DN4546_c0_g2_i1.p1 TRINITY_DN4546_c0_g2~~TRINITY_DN4546_c0_g2_i1.p1  ORF type:complete len:552 (-),score=107.98 TRINITY_DN4546_c0_g2_i1:153-1808(-)